MWATLDGVRKLRGAELQLFGAAIGELAKQIDISDSAPGPTSGIEWFDQWEATQQVWLLKAVSEALLTDATPPSPSAMFDGTIDALMMTALQQIEEEIGARWEEPTHWRSLAVRAFRVQTGRLPEVTVECQEMKGWSTLIGQITDAIVGVPAYQRAEMLRDGDYTTLQRYLESRFLPADYLQRIPPLVSTTEARRWLTDLQ